MNEDYSELSVYRSDYEANRARWETTPGWRLIKRARRYETVRSAYANLVGALSAANHYEIPDIAPTGRKKVASKFASISPSRWDWGGIFFVVGGVLVIAFFVGMFYLAIRASNARDHRDEALPNWIHPDGNAFYIDPSYSHDKKSAEWLGHADKQICSRIPHNGTRGHVLRTDSLPNGGIKVICRGVSDD